MYKKLFTTSIINAVNAVVNIFSSFIVVKVLSLEIYGQLAIFSSYIAFGGLIFAIIPSNFSIFKLQDDEKFKTILLSFFIIASVFFLIFLLIANHLGLYNIDIILVYFFGISTFFLGYFDIKFQALGQINKYFNMIFIVSIFKMFILLLFYFFNILNSLKDLILTISLAQSLVILIFLFQDRKEINYIFKNFRVFVDTFLFIKDNILIFRSYYLNTFLKRIRDNVIILTFSRFISNDVIGLFSIFLKITSFIFSLSRNLEAFFMNRDNINNYRKEFYGKIIYFEITLQVVFLIVGNFYLKFFIDKYYFFEIFILSFLVYPHVFFLLARSEMLSNYKNREVNFGETIYIFIIIIGALISYFLNFISIYGILTTYFLAILSLQSYLIFTLKNIRNKNNIID